MVTTSSHAVRGSQGATVFPAPHRREDRAGQSFHIESLTSRLENEGPQGLSEIIDRLLNAAGATPDPELLRLYVRFAVATGRPHTARCALRPLLQVRDSESGLLLADVLAGDGEIDRALKVAESLTARGSGAPMAGAERFDRYYSLSEHGPDPDLRKEKLRSLSQVLELRSGKGSEVIARIDKQLQTTALDEVEPVGLGTLFGRLLVQQLSGRWIWHSRLEDSTVRINTPNGELEMSPFVWASWRLESEDHQLLDVLRVAAAAAKGDKPDVEGYEDVLGRALCLAGDLSQPVLGLGLWADCPFARIRVPLVVESEQGQPTVVLSRPDDSESPEFGRYLDMLAFSRWGLYPWYIDSSGAKKDPEHALYETNDGTVRAALVARRLCSDDFAHNARWVVFLLQSLLDLPLDGSPESLTEVERFILSQLRLGGAERWQPVLEDRQALLFMLTCYVGEVLRAAYGGEWGRDRVTGDIAGPTCGLETRNARYNVGAQLLKTFFRGQQERFIPSAIRYATEIGQQNNSAAHNTIEEL